MLNGKNLLILIITAAVVAGSILFFKNNTLVKNRDSQGTTIVAFGDSLIEGIGATESNDFISLLSKRIGLPIINLGVSGNTTAQGLARVDQVLNQNPKIVIVLLGGNDYLKRVPMDETFANLEKIVDAIHSKGSMVLLLGVRGGILRDTYEDRFKDFAKEKQVAFVPNILDGLIGNDQYMSDAIHPNNLGYVKIADKVEPILRDLLK